MAWKCVEKTLKASIADECHHMYAYMLYNVHICAEHVSAKCGGAIWNMDTVG